MKIALIGKNGQVGFECRRTLSFSEKVLYLSRSDFNHDYNTLKNILLKESPDFIVNAAAYTNVDKAESEKEKCFSANVELPEMLSEICKTLNSSLIHLSTDYVFDGKSEVPYCENDEINPINYYGETKSLGESKVVTSGCDYIILRTSWVYGHKGINFVKKMISYAQEKETLKIINDQFGSPTSARFLAQLINNLILLNLNGFGSNAGIYHACASGQTSWFEFGKIVIEDSVPLIHKKVKEIIAVASTNFKTVAKRPIYSVLSTEKLSKTFNIYPPTWEELLSFHLEERDWSIIDE
ncbi:MAG: dTDP-4-dehydrorhamnose reductase [Planctomycetota bacterium]|nr:MAG: dTDP-4-dehydrorhamnose reductase [Planctomycetota bacterium]